MHRARARHSNASQIQSEQLECHSFVRGFKPFFCVSQSVSQPAVPTIVGHVFASSRVDSLPTPPVSPPFGGYCSLPLPELACVSIAPPPRPPSPRSSLPSLPPFLPRRPSSFSLRFFVPGHSFSSLCENSAFTSPRLPSLPRPLSLPQLHLASYPSREHLPRGSRCATMNC